MNLPTQLLHWFEQRQSKLCHRQLLVISGQKQWTINAAATLLANFDIQNVLWVGDSQMDYDVIDIPNYRSKLGQEYNCVVLDCFKGFRANAAMALSGTIKAQGIMIMLCPELSEWPNYDDPQQINRISYGSLQTNPERFFIQYLISTFVEDSTVAMISAEKFTGEVALVKNNVEANRYTEQDEVIKSVCKVAKGHRNRPLVITADRGRGKSSALGIAAAKLMGTSPKTICITAPNIHSVGQVFTHNKRLLPEADVTSNSVTYRESSLTFKPIDVLLNDECSLDLLLVDEASAIPVHILCKLAKKFSRIVFSSTIHGYEGSGRGFEMRFIKQLSLQKPSFKRVHIFQPIRWYHQDALEQYWFNTFFHNLQQDNKNHELSIQQTNCRYISKAQLLSDKTLLAEVFRLLIDAHYQTSQDDLQRFLDAPEIHCFILSKGTSLLGVAQIIEEGGDTLAELAECIADCSRRVNGHLVAQNIASSYNTPSFVLARQWRISRIAIAPEHQRNGLGKQLINFVEQQAKQRHIKFLSTSFGCNAEILRFWNKNEFLLTKLSAKPEISSGEHSAICLKPLTNQAFKIFEAIHQEFYFELLYQLDKHFQVLSEDLILQILQGKQNTDNRSCADVAILKQFAFGKRAYSTCKRLLKEYLLANPAAFSKLETHDQRFLVAALLQNQTDNYLCGKFSLSGKKQIQQTLKTSFAKILEADVLLVKDF